MDDGRGGIAVVPAGGATERTGGGTATFEEEDCGEGSCKEGGGGGGALAAAFLNAAMEAFTRRCNAATSFSNQKKQISAPIKHK